jgi:apolipoprotein N-acyltransferase
MERAVPVPLARALLVQPAVPLSVKRGSDEVALQASLDAIEAALPPPAAPQAPPVGGDFVVLPETAIPIVLDAPHAGAVRERVAAWVGRMGAPIVLGAWAAGPGRGGNAVFVASGDPDDSWPAAWKVRLVPGVEWTPGFSDAVAAGDRPRPVEVPNGPVLGALICIESAGPEPARSLVREGAELLVNITNDAWLAEEPWWTRTSAFHQHPAHLAFRAVELGVGAVRVGNNGRTEVVDPLGRRALVVPAHVSGHGVASVLSLARPTPFLMFGPWMGPAAVAGAVLLLLAPLIRPRRTVDPPPPL